MKTTFKSNEIAHVWAHKQAPYGKSPGAMSFRGDCFLSYSTVIARLIERNGTPAVIINTRPFSSTTSQHHAYVRRALDSDRITFYFEAGYNTDLNPSGKELFEYAIAMSVDEAQKASKARQRKVYHHGQQASWLARAKQVSSFFGLRRKVDEKTIERLRESSAKAEREEKRRQAIREEKARIEQTEQYEAWKAGTASVHGFNVRLFPVAFRIESRKGSGEHAYELVSTLGARVPIAEARKALAFVLKHREANWSRNGQTFPVGMYQLDSISPDGVKAGCHNITWSEIDRLVSIL
jgi:hypothetical protein